MFVMYIYAKVLAIPCFLLSFVMVNSAAISAPQTCSELEAWKNSQIQKDVQERTQHHKDIKVLRKRALQDVDEKDEQWLKAHGKWVVAMEKQYIAYQKALKCKEDKDNVPQL